MREFLEVKRIPKETRSKVRQFMRGLYKTKTAYDEQDVLSKLPPAMAKQLLDYMYRKQLASATPTCHPHSINVYNSQIESDIKHIPTLRMQLQPVFHCSSLNALDPGSGR